MSVQLASIIPPKFAVFDEHPSLILAIYRENTWIEHMDEVHFDQHISQRYNAELEDIRARALQMGGMVEKQLSNALKALVEGNGELAHAAVEGDKAINDIELEIDEECTQILARRQPAASDLRLVVSIFKVITDLERMGDEAQRVARMAVSLAEHDRPQNRYSEIRHLGQHVLGMLRDTLDAFARMDIDAALQVLEEDRKVDEEYEALLRQLITYMMEAPSSIPRSLEIMWSARSIERIGDRACNIAECVIYFVRGEDIRHRELDTDTLRRVRAE